MSEGWYPLVVRIPGEPCAQGRPRAFLHPRSRRLIVTDAPKSRSWKAVAVDLMGQARGGPDLDVTFPGGPLDVHVVAVFSCPRGEFRKRERTPRRWHTKARGDADNVAKAVMDAATAAGLWQDDAQVARLLVEKWVAAQEEPPFVEIHVRPLESRTDVSTEAPDRGA